MIVLQGHHLQKFINVEPLAPAVIIDNVYDETKNATIASDDYPLEDGMTNEHLSLYGDPMRSSIMSIDSFHSISLEEKDNSNRHGDVIVSTSSPMQINLDKPVDPPGEDDNVPVDIQELLEEPPLMTTVAARVDPSDPRSSLTSTGGGLGSVSGVDDKEVI